MNIAVLIPVYNEQASIATVIEDFAGALPGALLVVVDNNSSDATAQRARQALDKQGGRGEVLFEARQGKAAALRRGLRAVDADIYVMVDADATYPADAVHRLIEPVARGTADLVVGDRMGSGAYQRQNRRRFHAFGNRLVVGLINRLFRANIQDAMSGYRAMSRTFAQHYPMLCDGFELETEMTLHALDRKFTIQEIPIDYRARPTDSESKLDTFRHGGLVLWTIVSVFRYYKPLAFFGALSLLFALAGLVVGAFPILEYATSGYVYKVPSAILASGLMIFSLVLFAVSIILDTMLHLHRIDYEVTRNRSGHRGNRDQRVQRS